MTTHQLTYDQLTYDQLEDVDVFGFPELLDLNIRRICDHIQDNVRAIAHKYHGTSLTKQNLFQIKQDISSFLEIIQSDRTIHNYSVHVPPLSFQAENYTNIDIFLMFSHTTEFIRMTVTIS